VESAVHLAAKRAELISIGVEGPMVLNAPTGHHAACPLCIFLGAARDIGDAVLEAEAHFETEHTKERRLLDLNSF
jgi:hypothetical protein